MDDLSLQSYEGNDTCHNKPTLVSQPYYRLDIFNRQMTGVLFTSVLVTTDGEHTLGHFGTSDGRILQVDPCPRRWWRWSFLRVGPSVCVTFCCSNLFVTRKQPFTQKNKPIIFI